MAYDYEWIYAENYIEHEIWGIILTSKNTSRNPSYPRAKNSQWTSNCNDNYGRKDVPNIYFT